jgi:hypothetical protein
MEDDKRNVHHVDIERNLHLETWEAAGRYFWDVTDSKTHEQVGAGEASNLEAAKIEAAAVAGVQWKCLTWRGAGT